LTPSPGPASAFREPPELIRKAAELRSLEVFLNLPFYDMKLNVLWVRPDDARPEQVARMNAFWGDDSWKREAYRLSSQQALFEQRTQTMPGVWTT